MTALARAADPDGIPEWAGPFRRSWMRGLTDRQMAARHGVHLDVIRRWRHRNGLAPNVARWPRTAPVEGRVRALKGANRARAERAAARTVADAKAVLDAADDGTMTLSARYRAVLTARVADPWASLAELAATLGMRKDQYAAALRRALLVHGPHADSP